MLTNGLFKGVHTAWIDSFTSGTFILTVYEPLKYKLTKLLNGSDKGAFGTPSWIKFLSGGISASLSKGIFNPIDLIRVRLIA